MGTRRPREDDHSLRGDSAVSSHTGRDLLSARRSAVAATPKRSYAGRPPVRSALSATLGEFKSARAAERNSRRIQVGACRRARLSANSSWRVPLSAAHGHGLTGGEPQTERRGRGRGNYEQRTPWRTVEAKRLRGRSPSAVAARCARCARQPRRGSLQPLPRTSVENGR